MAYYWLSFADKKKFLGGCLVEAESPGEAIEEAWRWKCNPGGDVAIVRVDAKHEVNVNKFKLNHLYSKKELIKIGEHHE